MNVKWMRRVTFGYLIIIPTNLPEKGNQANVLMLDKRIDVKTAVARQYVFTANRFRDIQNSQSRLILRPFILFIIFCASQKRFCRACDGSAFCPHGRQKARCKGTWYFVELIVFVSQLSSML